MLKARELPGRANPVHGKRQRTLLLGAIWTAFVVAILPVVFRWQPPNEASGHKAHLQLDLAYLLSLLLCGWLYRLEARRLGRKRAATLIFLIFLLTNLLNSIHRFYVDHSSLSAAMSNLTWQRYVQQEVMKLSPVVAPHSYRFLPNAIVRWMELGEIAYEPARDIYRLIVGILLFYAFYRYARIFAGYVGALFALLLTAVIYPVSFEYYAGQLTDPLSHLSFVLAFIFIESGDFALLLTTLVIGSLAKETVLAMTGYYLLFQWRESRFGLKAATLCAAALAAYFGVRAYVLERSGAYHYEQVSGVAPDHAWINLTGGRWLPLVVLTAGALLPFLLLGWRETPRSLKRLALYLFPVLFVSSTFFGWLFEGRNFMPLVFVMAAASGKYFETLTGADSSQRSEDAFLPLQATEGSEIGDRE